MKEPSLIRVESDEVTYPLHVIIRYEVERAMMNGELAVADVPAVWNAKMQEYLGCTPSSDKEVRCAPETRAARPRSHDAVSLTRCCATAQGCLQDIHWAMGALGYFTTYTLGAMYAAQLFFAAKKDLPTLDQDIEQGEFSELREWLREKVHKLGSVPPTGDDLMTAVTGEPLNVGIFLDYLRTKYRALYHL